YYRELAANQIGRQRGQSVILPFCPAILDRGVLPFDVASLLQPLAERADERHKSPWGCAVEEPDHWRRRLLPARRERPDRRSAAEQVSGLFTQSGGTAGPDGVREPRPHHSSGIDVPMNRQASLGCVRRKRNQFRRVSASSIGITGAPA